MPGLPWRVGGRRPLTSGAGDALAHSRGSQPRHVRAAGDRLLPSTIWRPDPGDSAYLGLHSPDLAGTAPGAALWRDDTGRGGARLAATSGRSRSPGGIWESVGRP